MRKSTISLAVMLLGAACSHQQTAPAKPSVQARAPRLPEPRIIAPEPEAPTPTPSAAQAPENPSIYFDFDSHLLRNGDRPTLQKVAAAAHGKAVRIEGNCDERGTAEYNLALGDARAREAEQYLERLGIPKRKLTTVTYGSEHPRAPGHDESAWSQNRRDDFIIQ